MKEVSKKDDLAWFSSFLGLFDHLGVQNGLQLLLGFLFAYNRFDVMPLSKRLPPIDLGRVKVPLTWDHLICLYHRPTLDVSTKLSIHLRLLRSTQ